MTIPVREASKLEETLEHPSVRNGVRKSLRDRVDDLKGQLVAAFLIALVALGTAGVAVDLQTLAQGDEFHMQERVNVALTRSVVLEILDNEGMVWVERAVGDSTPIHTPAGTFVGPEGAMAFATLLAGGEEDRGFELQVVGANGDLVELDWRLAGPLTPGIVKGEYIPAASYVSGRVTVTVIDGSVEEMSFLVD
jgi:hypothetical protein